MMSNPCFQCLCAPICKNKPPYKFYRDCLTYAMFAYNYRNKSESARDLFERADRLTYLVQSKKIFNYEFL